MFHPCALKTYKPCSVLTLQPSLPLPARATPDVPSAIAATRLTNAHAKSEQLVILLNNFVFITIITLSCVDLLWLLVIENSFPAVHRSTERKPARGYSENWETFSKQRKQKRERLYLVTTSESRPFPLLPSVRKIVSGEVPLR